MFVTKLIPVGE